MKNLPRIAVLFATGFFILSSCSNQPISNKTVSENRSPNLAASGQNAPNLIVTPAIKENIVRLRIGDVFEFQIPTIPVVGFAWMIEKMDKAILAQVGESVFKADSSPNSAGGKSIFQFKALAQGSTVIVFDFAKPESNGTPALSSKSIALTVEIN